MPGARAAFFRNCSFESIKKDTTVDNRPYFVRNAEFNALDLKFADQLTNTQIEILNRELLKLSNGGGAAITTFSART
jgi:hypothetical protein